MEKFYFIILFLFSISFVAYAFADITLEGINVNLDKSTWNFPNSITVSNFFVQNNGITLKLDDVSEQRKYNFFRSGSLTPYDISLVDFTAEKIDFTIDTLGLTDAVLNVSGTQIDGVTLNGVVSSFTYDGVVNTININSATLVSIYFSNAPLAPQGGGNSGGDNTAPSFNTFSVTGARTQQEDGTIGFGGILSQEIQLTNKMPTAIVETGNEIQLRMLLYENSGTSALQHIGLYTNLYERDRIDKSDTFVEYDKGKPIKIVNKNGYLKDADVSFVERNNNVEVVFSLTFAKPMDTSNIIVRAWDSNRNSRDAVFFDAIKVEQAEDVITPSNLPQLQPEIEIESDLVKMDPEPLLSIPILKQWAGFSEDSISDEEFLKNLGIQGTKIPSWFKKSQVSKWVIEETISQRELLDTLKFFQKSGLLS